MARLSGRRRLVAAATAAATGLAGTALLLGPGTGSASSHREAPYTAGDPRADNTDVYAFVSPDDPDTVTLIANWIPFQEPNGGPNFYPFEDGVAYDIEIDNDGDAQSDVVYRWLFTSTWQNPNTFLYNTGPVTGLNDPDLNFRQSYDLQVSLEGGAFTTIAEDRPVAPDNVGPASMPDYADLRQAAVVDVPLPAVPGATARSFAGQADDPFFLDLRVFDLLYGGDLSEVGNDTLNGYNVKTIALQVPKEVLALNRNAQANPVIGVFSTTSRPSVRTFDPDLGDDGGVQPGTGGDFAEESGDYAQVSRLGNPLVNEVVIPVRDKDRFNNSRPAGDTQFLPYVQDPEVPRLIEAIYGIPAPDSDEGMAGTQREDLVEVFLTGVCDVAGCPQGVDALDANLNSQLLNADVDAAAFQASEMLRLNMAVPPSAEPARLGVLAGDLAGFPNGRRLGDDVIDIALQVMEGELLGNANDLGDAVGSNDLQFSGEFPYVALPHNSAVNQSQFTMFERLSGPDRYATAAAIARDSFPSAGTAILVNGDTAAFPDALTANYLAGDRQAPILLTTRDTTPEVTMAALRDLGVDEVLIVGGSARVSPAQEAALRSERTVVRVAGSDRYMTAAAVARAGRDAPGQATAVLAGGNAWPDALVAGPIAYQEQFPVLLTASGSLVPAASQALEELGIERVLIAGGTAVVSTGVEEALTGLGIEVVRLGGQDRMETGVLWAQYAVTELGFDPTHINLARGDVPVDSLTGGPHAGREAAPILLTQSPTTLGPLVTAFLADRSIALEAGHVFGGRAAVSDAVVAAATDTANAED